MFTSLSELDKIQLRKFNISQEVSIKIFKLKSTARANENAQVLHCNLNCSGECNFISTDKYQLSKHKKLQHNAIKPFKCGQCDYSGATIKLLWQHKRTHSSYIQFTCTDCNYKTNSKNNLKRHVNARHNKNPEGRQKNFPCQLQLCTKSFYTLSELKQHEKTHSSYKPFTCTDCTYKTNHKDVLQRHVNARHNKNPEGRQRNFPCQVCTKSFYTFSVLQQHKMTHTKEKPFSCQFCRHRTFLMKASKNKHEAICEKNPNLWDPAYVENQKQFECNVCNIKLRRKHSMAYHLKTHTAIKSFKCGSCEYAATSDVLLKLHTSRRHNPHRIHPFPCTLCPKTFLTKNELHRHIVTHTKEKPFQCEFCNQKFGSDDGRKKHLRICDLNPKKKDVHWVESQKKFKCELCDYSSIHSSKLQRHKQTHTRDNCATSSATSSKNDTRSRHDLNIIKCNLCPRTYSTKSALRQHIFTHTKEKPFPCEFCSRGFLSTVNRKRHSIACKLNPKQNDEKWVQNQYKFKCELCEYKSVRKDSYTQHRRTHTGEKVVNCPLCNYNCSQPAALDTHMRTHTREKPFKCSHCPYRGAKKCAVTSHTKRLHPEAQHDS